MAWNTMGLVEARTTTKDHSNYLTLKHGASLHLLALCRRRRRHPLLVVELGHVHGAAPRKPAAHALTALLLCLGVGRNSIDLKLGLPNYLRISKHVQSFTKRLLRGCENAAGKLRQKR